MVKTDRNMTLEESNEWYSHDMVKWEIAKAMHYREIGFSRIDGNKTLPPLRAFTIRDLNYLNYFFDKNGVLRKPVNVYSSTAKVKNIPTFTLNAKIRHHTPEMEKFNEEFIKYVIDYDLLIDLDTEGQILPDQVFIQSIGITELLDRYHIPYSIRISGRGIHIFIEGENFKKNVFDKPSFYREILYNLKNVMGFTMIDETIHPDSIIDRRYFKSPYTYDHKSGNVCFPITKQQLLSFHKDYTPKYIIKNIQLFKRGLPIQNKEKNPQTLKFIQHIKPD